MTKKENNKELEKQSCECEQKEHECQCSRENNHKCDCEKKEHKEQKKKAKNKELEKLQEENIALKDKILRLNAEIANIRRHNEEERSRLIKYDGEKIIIDLLESLDNFERAVSMDDDNLEDEVSKFLSGFKMIYTNLVNKLKNLGVEEIKAQGEKFDPNFMEAVLTDKNDKFASNVVTEVLQKGYKYKDKVIRPAMVKVNE